MTCKWCGRARCRSSHGGRMRVRATRHTSTAVFHNGEDEPLATPTALPEIIGREDMVPQDPCRTWWADLRTKSKTYGFVVRATA
jgi:hypothetical protein